jgi:putative transcriptional regulator
MDDTMFKDLVQSVKQAADHAGGKRVPGVVVHVPKLLDVVAIRQKTGLAQSAFSRTIGVSVGTLQNWEQGRRQPEGPARVLLAMVEKNPTIVGELLGVAA